MQARATHGRPRPDSRNRIAEAGTRTPGNRGIEPRRNTITIFMTNAFYTMAGAILVLGVMVLVHEFGHYAAAKLLGVRVEVFSIGFGRRLLGFRYGDTDYRISALPLGGYVKMT